MSQFHPLNYPLAQLIGDSPVFEVSYTIHDASRATGVPVSTLQFFIKNGELPTVKLGRVRVIR